MTRKRLLTDEQVTMLSEWWKWRRISNKAMCRKLGVHKKTLYRAVRRQGAYRAQEQ